jgi:hypothetical protein
MGALRASPRKRVSGPVIVMIGMKWGLPGEF